MDSPGTDALVASIHLDASFRKRYISGDKKRKKKCKVIGRAAQMMKNQSLFEFNRHFFANYS